MLIFSRLVIEEQMRAIKSSANWISVDCHKDLREAQEMMSRGLLPQSDVD